MSSTAAPPRRYRWAILAAGVVAQASFSALLIGLASITPAIQHRYALSLAQVGVVLAAVNLHQVKVDWILGTWSTPLIIVIAVAFVLGVATGTALHLEGRRRARKKRTRPAA